MTRSLIGVLCLGIAVIAALVGSCLLFHRRGYEKGYRDGFRAAHGIVEFLRGSLGDWWGVAEREVTKVLETIKHESGNEERWP